MLDKVKGELQAITKIMASNGAFSSFLANPTIPREVKTQTLQKLISTDKFSHISQNLLVTLAANGRAGSAGKVVEQFFELMEARRGTVKAVVITAEPVNAKMQKSLEAAVAGMVEAGKKVTIVFQLFFVL